MKKQKCEEKIYNVAELYVVGVKNKESVIYYIVEPHESIKEFLTKIDYNKKTQFKEVLTGFLISSDDVCSLESLREYYSLLELPKYISKKEILDQYIAINEFKLHPGNEYSDANIEKEEIVIKKEK